MTDTSPVTDDLANLGGRLEGQLITAETSGYEEARMVADLSFDRRPLAIVKAASVNDVVATVNFARESGLTLAVRGGGHSLAGHGTCDDGLVLDLSAMKAIVVDPAARTARVQGGATSGDLVGPAHEHGLALSTGDTSSVGLGGLATGGGIGFMVRKNGLAIDNMLSAQVVTADGRVLTASENENPDLFWAVRGGGGNFGVVTEFEFRLAEAGNLLCGGLVLPASREVVRGVLDCAVNAPDDLTIIMNLAKAPPAPFIPPEWLGKLVCLVLVCWTGDPSEGEKVIAPIRELAEPVADMVSVMPYPAIYNFTAEAAQPAPNVVRSLFAHEISDATIDHAISAIGGGDMPMNMFQFRVMGGAMSRVPVDATAFSHRDVQYQATIITLWEDLSDDYATYEAWADALWEKIRGDMSGSYVNFIDDEDDQRVEDAYSAETFKRLTEIKAKYDPANLFRLNQNIKPASK